jgi:hypothetical protein
MRVDELLLRRRWAGGASSRRDAAAQECRPVRVSVPPLQRSAQQPGCDSVHLADDGLTAVQRTCMAGGRHRGPPGRHHDRAATSLCPTAAPRLIQARA